MLALDALGAGPAVPDTVIAFDLDGPSVRLVHSGGRLGLADRSQRQPELRVTADASTVLGLAAGELTIAQARRSLRLDPDTLRQLGPRTALLPRSRRS